MVDEADVYVNNNLAGTISAARYCLPGENKDLEVSITSGNDEMIHLVRTETYLIIEPPSGKYTSDCTFSVSNEQLLAWSTMDDHWKVEIKPNSLPPDAPTTVNIDLNNPGS